MHFLLFRCQLRFVTQRASVDPVSRQITGKIYSMAYSLPSLKQLTSVQRSARQQGIVPAQAAAAAPSISPAMQASGTSGVVRYVQRPKDPQAELYTYLYEKPADIDASNMHHIERKVHVSNLRETDKAFTLAENGFQLETFHVDPSIDWDNEEEVKATYYPALEALLKKVAGATRVHVFDHTLRRGEVKAQDQAEDKPDLELELAGKPVARVHVDYTTKSGVERLHTLLPDEADKLQKTPFAVIQVWRPLRGPVEESPLGMIDVSSLTQDDYMSYTLHFPGRTGYNYCVLDDNAHRHRWFYAKNMDVDEAYVFTCYDSRKGRARFTPHTGFRDLSTGADAHPRHSVEARCYVFWKNEGQQPYELEL